MRSAAWYRQRAVDCLEEGAKIFGDANQTAWLRTIADRWFRIARNAETSATDRRLSLPQLVEKRGVASNALRVNLAPAADVRVYERRLPLSAIAQCPPGDLLAYWKRRRPAGSPGALPARRDLDVLAIRPLLGHINLVAVHREPATLRLVWRMHGTDSVLVHGVDRTGKDTSTLRPAHYRELVDRHYRECVACGAPTLYEIVSDFDDIRQPQYYRRLLLPLAADGRTVDMLLVAWDADLRDRIAFTDRLERDRSDPLP